MGSTCCDSMPCSASYRFNLGINPFGWAGVWLFFVISGFVITLSLILLRHADLSLRSALSVFYYKRTLRIFPLYFLFIAVGIAAIIVSGNFRHFHHLPYLFTFTYNFYRVWPLYEFTPLFGHYWNVSVEEQFYLLYSAAAVNFREEDAAYLASCGRSSRSTCHPRIGGRRRVRLFPKQGSCR